jgi:hypothetical protein
MVSTSGTPPISFVDNIETYDTFFFFVIDGGSKNASILELDAIWGLIFPFFQANYVKWHPHHRTQAFRHFLLCMMAELLLHVTHNT